VKASLRWLGELLGGELDPVDTRDRLAMLGAPADAMDRLHADLAGVVIGQVVEAGKHPNADRLSICRVNAGAAQDFHVVCGAPNVRAGAKYPFAPVGTVLPGGLKLERRKIRGETSEGMLCSARELGLGEDRDGILELATDAAPGTPLLDVLQIADVRYELDVGANRPDLLSHEGLARDLGAVLRRAVKLPALPGAPEPPRVPRAAGAGGTAGGVRVTIEDTEGCPRYTAAVIRGMRVGPSPAWLRDRLAALGARSINSVVDATNYLLFENGQPLHAFDLATLRGPAIVVRRARAGETLTTLDGVARTLTPEMCVIADGERATGLAGVMGGAESEVTAGTTDVLLECAYFDPPRTRRTRRALGLSTEASYRFERGVDPEATATRLARAAQLIVAVAGGRIDACVDVYPAPLARRTVFLRDAKLTQVLGVAVDRADVERTLTAIGCVVGPRGERSAVQVPAWRPDLTREIDLVEEVARLVGYDRFPDELRAFRPNTVPDAGEERLADRLRTLLTGLGLHEASTLPLGPRVDERQPAVLNPLSQEEAYLRHDLLTGLDRRVEHNWRQMARDVRLFEIGRVFDASRPRVEKTPEREVWLPHEETRVAAVITGARRPPHWSEPRPPDADVFDARAILEAIIAVVAPGAHVEPDGSQSATPSVVAGQSGPLTPHRPDPGWDIHGWVVRGGRGTIIGRAGGRTLDPPAWAAAAFGIELMLPATLEERIPRAMPVPAWPAVERDVALVLPPRTSAQDVEGTVRSAAGDLLERLWVFDEYRGQPLAPGERSVAWRLVFRAPDRTLRDAEADTATEKAVNAVRERHGVRRREA